MSTTEKKVTGPMEVIFMNTTKSMENKFNGKQTFSIRGLLDATDPAIADLRALNEDIVDTKTNRNSTDQSKKIISFSSTFRPVGINISGEYILTKDGEVVDEDSAWINTKYDKATVQVVYKHHAAKGVNLVGFKVLSLVKGDRPETEEGTATKGQVQDLLNGNL